MKKIIGIILLIMMIMGLASGCATVMRELDKGAVETEAPTEEVATEPAEPSEHMKTLEDPTQDADALSGVEKMMENKFGKENVEFVEANNGASFSVFYYASYSYSTFYAPENEDDSNLICRTLNSMCATAYEALDYDAVSIFLIDKNGKLVYATSNGEDTTAYWTLAIAREEG